MGAYRATTEMPPLVREARRISAKAGFSGSCSPEVGRLLHVLAASVQQGPVAEIGTGCGVGAAWIVSSLPPSNSFTTVEIDPGRATLAQGLFATYPNVRVVCGEWHRILPDGPFALLFADAGTAKVQEAEITLGALRPGGLLVLDDLTPESQWTAEQRRLWTPDPVRSFWLNDPRVVATEILVTDVSSVILARRQPRDGS
jgi:predicted O-methyltransferase YrrM